VVWQPWHAAPISPAFAACCWASTVWPRHHAGGGRSHTRHHAYSPSQPSATAPAHSRRDGLDPLVRAPAAGPAETGRRLWDRSKKSWLVCRCRGSFVCLLETLWMTMRFRRSARHGALESTQGCADAVAYSTQLRWNGPGCRWGELRTEAAA
jgi:hypothetical protein